MGHNETLHQTRPEMYQHVFPTLRILNFPPANQALMMIGGETFNVPHHKLEDYDLSGEHCDQCEISEVIAIK